MGHIPARGGDLALPFPRTVWYNLVNSLTLIKWWLEQDHIGLEQVHGIMGDNMRQGIFQAFHNYVWEKDT